MHPQCNRPHSANMLDPDQPDSDCSTLLRWLQSDHRHVFRTTRRAAPNKTEGGKKKKKKKKKKYRPKSGQARGGVFFFLPIFDLGLGWHHSHPLRCSRPTLTRLLTLTIPLPTQSSWTSLKFLNDVMDNQEMQGEAGTRLHYSSRFRVCVDSVQF